MNNIRTSLLWSGITLLSACSSAPEPPQPPESYSASAINTTLPVRTNNNLTFPSPVISGHWQVTINFTPHAIYPLKVEYALVHAKSVAVYTSQGETYFQAKRWLHERGYKGVITFIPKYHNSLINNQTEITFYR